MTDPLEQLLKQTDRDATPLPPAAGDLPFRLRHALKRRRTARRAVIASTTAAFSLGTVLFVALHFPQSAIRNPKSDVSPPQSSVLSIQSSSAEAQVASLEARVAFLESSERLARAESRLSSLAVSTGDHSASERAAASILFRANRLAEQSSLHADAAQAYHDVIRAFPGTMSANTARQKLAQLQKENPV